MKILRCNGAAIYGRIPPEEEAREFKKYGLDLCINIDINRNIDSKYKFKDMKYFCELCNKFEYDWIIFGVEHIIDKEQLQYIKENTKCKTFVYGQEQAQSYTHLSSLFGYASKILTSSPIFTDFTDGYLPVPCNDFCWDKQIPKWEDKENIILISGSNRAYRYQLIKYLLQNQPFKWPVHFMPSAIEWEPINKQEYLDLIKDYPQFITKSIPKNHPDFNPCFFNECKKSKIFIDLTFNAHPNLKVSGSHLRTSMDQVFSYISENNYKGGYAPTRVLNAMLCNNFCIVLEDPAQIKVFGNNCFYYRNLEILHNQVNKAIDNEKFIKNTTDTLGPKVYKQFSYQNIIKYICNTILTNYRNDNEFILK